MLPGAAGANRKPVLLLHSGRVHPNPFFQQAYAFTGRRASFSVTNRFSPRAIEECFPCSARQRCLAHRMRNLAIKDSADLWPEFKARVAACHQALSRAIARELASGIRADYAVVAPSALACFDDDFEARVAHLRLPVTHRRGARTTNLLERVILACVTCSTRSSGVLARPLGLSR
jgi:transposase-like protein